LLTAELLFQAYESCKTVKEAEALLENIEVSKYGSSSLCSTHSAKLSIAVLMLSACPFAVVYICAHMSW